LNAAVDRSLWRTTDYGDQGPYQHQRIVNLIDPATATERRFITSTWGGAACFRELRNAVRTMRQLRGRQMAPIVELKVVKWGKRGPQLGPCLHIVDWMEFGATAPARIAPAASPQQAQPEEDQRRVAASPAASPTPDDYYDDYVPF
jgi:hypothetical protein